MACKNDNSACLHFLHVTMSPDPYFHFISRLYLSNLLKYFDTLLEYRIGQRGVSHAIMKTAFLHYLP